MAKARQRAKRGPGTMAASRQSGKKSPSLVLGVLPAPPAPDGGKNLSSVAYENIATKESPVYRKRMVLPLTPRAVREEQVRNGDVRRTPLDALLTEEQAAALELYVWCEDVLAGNARVQDYCGDRVQSGRLNMAPVADWMLADLADHARLKRLRAAWCDILAHFVAQQRRDPDALSDAQLGCRYDAIAKNKAAAWRKLVAQAAARLVTAA